MIGNRATRRPARLALTLALTGFAVASATGGCDCQGGGVSQVAPKLVVTPSSITFPATAVKSEADQVVTIKNDGSELLHITADPQLTEGSEDTLTELALRQVLNPVDCSTGASRNSQTPKALQPGECDTITVVYVPQNLGKDTGTLVIKSDDPKHKEVDVPIDATGAAPKIQACLLPGDCVTTKTCSKVGSQLDLPFPQTAINTATTCDVSISNLGQLPLKNLDWGFKKGNRYKDYTLDPAELSTFGDLAPGKTVTTHVKFSPLAGGAHDAILEITSNDPVQGGLDINLTGVGDGPKLCSDPVPVVDYGTVEINTTSTKTVTLTDCGTEPLQITKLEVQDGNGAGPSTQFAMGSGAPSTPISLNAGASATVPVDFTPDSVTTFNGRLYLESTDPVVPSGWISLTGVGQEAPACQLQVATRTVDFGQGAPGNPVTKTLAVSNPGQLPCTNVAAAITAGANVSFAITGTPSQTTLQPGDIVLYTLQYSPADSTGPDTGTLEVSSTDIATPIDVTLKGTPVAQATCQLDVTPHTGNFNFSGCLTLSVTPRVAEYGAVRVSQNKTLTASLEDVGSADCHVSSVKMVGVDITKLFAPDPNYTLVNGQQVMVNGTATGTIHPGELGEVAIKYEPAATGQDCGGVQIQTDDPSADGSECDTINGGQQGCYQVYLQGQGVESDIEVIPTDVKFGVITVGCASLERKVTIYNNGGASMNVSDIYIDPPGKGAPPSGPFTLTSVPPLPVSIPGGGTLQIKLKYKPGSTNADNAVLAIESDAANASILTVPLSGQGTTDSHQTDTFTQLAQPEVDVLFMIDDSCSMNDKQQSLANNAATFFQIATSLNTNYQVAVVSNNIQIASESGNFQSRNGAPKIITPSTPNPAQAFADNVLLGSGGGDGEQAFAAIHEALTPPLINDPAKNGGFLRDGAKLVVVNVMDEDDQSKGTVDYYVDFLKNIKGYRNADLMSVSSIVGYDETTKKAADCTTPTGAQAVAGPRFVDMSTRTNGILRSICDSDWGKIANDIGLNTFGSRSQFFLSRDPVVTSIVVKVDGTQSNQPDWSYDAPSNSIIFDKSAVPAQGATITVDYDTVCH